MGETQKEAERVKKKLAGKLKDLISKGIEVSDDGNSRVHTPDSSSSSDDSTK